ncbi:MULTISPECIES: alpha/beta fold hydrolase [Burkholderia]|uniref:alpha/beta fold hydrolase n=1 Tax=Burkholderia TaxID=32008 RepID=UPI000841DF39|nr:MULTISPECIES: alpha/beta fold hydrolase [unclassified Burkholderia]AOK32018.1 hypothetical protein AQ611_21270 [Burkholderia sp. Bp7605]
MTPEQAAILFLTPRREAATDNHPPFDGASGDTTDFEGAALVSWQAGAGPTVLLVHGWEASAGAFKRFVPPLVAAGYRVVAIDLPAHGRSAGSRTSIVDGARAVRQLTEHLGPVHAIVAHSIGCAIAVEAMKAGASANAAVLIAPPARYRDYASAFAMQAGLSTDDAKQMVAHLLALGVDVASVDTPRAVQAFGTRALIVHSEDDRVVPVSQGREIAAAWPGARFAAVNGLGHRRILDADEVIDAAVTFIQAPRNEPRGLES